MFEKAHVDAHVEIVRGSLRTFVAATGFAAARTPRSRTEGTQMMIDRIMAVTIKELRQLSRDKLTFGLIVGIPLMQMLLFGYAINFDVRELRAAVVDEADTSGSRALIGDVQASGVVRFLAPSRDVADLKRRMNAGEIKVGMVIPADFERRRIEHDRAVVQLLIDGSEPLTDSVAKAIANGPLPARNGLYASRVGVFEVRTEYNPERRTAVQVVPALIGVILNMTMVIFTAAAIVRERERGNFELLNTTPVRSWELMAGKLIPYVFIGMLQTTLVLVAGSLLFDVPVNGRLPDLYMAAALFIAATLTLGLLISTVTRTQFQAFQLAFMTMLPSILLSGFMFPFDGMPKAIQYFAQVLPLTHFVRWSAASCCAARRSPTSGLPAAKLACSPPCRSASRHCASASGSTDDTAQVAHQYECARKDAWEGPARRCARSVARTACIRGCAHAPPGHRHAAGTGVTARATVLRAAAQRVLAHHRGRVRSRAGAAVRAAHRGAAVERSRALGRLRLGGSTWQPGRVDRARDDRAERFRTALSPLPRHRADLLQRCDRGCALSASRAAEVAGRRRGNPRRADAVVESRAREHALRGQARALASTVALTRSMRRRPAARAALAALTLPRRIVILPHRAATAGLGVRACIRRAASSQALPRSRRRCDRAGPAARAAR
jgi:ABC-2 type transport system permease protein